MSSQKSRLDQEFLDRQKRRLIGLRMQILEVRQGQQSEQASANSGASGEAHEYEDDAQKLVTLELQGNLAAVENERLSGIERALQKIDDQSYGLSDSSGASISIERLNASPEAVYTLEEQQSRDTARR